jgi:hypothetical protein
MRMIIDGSLTPLNLSTTLRASRRRETPTRADDYSLRKMQNVRVDSPAKRIMISVNGNQPFGQARVL